MSSVGMSWMNAETGSATARVTGGIPPVFRSFAAAAFLLILRILLPMSSQKRTKSRLGMSDEKLPNSSSKKI